MLTINISETIWTLICFLLLYFGLKKFLYEPIMRFMDERRERVAAGFDAEREAQKQVRSIEEEAAENRQKLSEDAKERLALLGTASEKERERLINEERVRSREAKQSAMNADGSAEADKLALKLPGLARRLAEIVTEN